MQDLSSKKISLTPTSQEGGGMAYDNKKANSAPGSTPVTPMLTPQGNPLPLPVPDPMDETENVALSTGDTRTAGEPYPKAQGSGGGWTDTHDLPTAGGWKRTQ